MAADTKIQDVIRRGEITSYQLTRMGSNYTFLCMVEFDGQSELAIYKPRDGEAPLWDFPRGSLYKREYAAYLLSDHLGWDLVPFTIIREGPHGVGSVQQFIEHDTKQNYYNLSPDFAPQLKVICCFDLVANSTDRKANHLIADESGKLWSIDHGLTFHSDIKIRTVIWDFGGEAIPGDLLDRLTETHAQLLGPPGEVTGSLRELVEVLEPGEVNALKERLEWVLTERTYPGIPGRRRRR